MNETEKRTTMWIGWGLFVWIALVVIGIILIGVLA